MDSRNFTQKTPPKIPYEKIKNAVLGEVYDLSLAFIGSTRSRRLNRERRGKDKAANVLSFPYSKTEGELLLDLNFAKTEEKALLLFIHGLFHLKGMDHGSIMDRNEEKILRLFSPFNNATIPRNRNRHRNLVNSSDRRRVRKGQNTATSSRHRT